MITKVMNKLREYNWTIILTLAVLVSFWSVIVYILFILFSK